MHFNICLTFISYSLAVGSHSLSKRFDVSYGSPAYKHCECGRANTKFIDQARILGGYETRPNEYPWMALIFGIDGNDSSTQVFCGGSVISDQYVITAAHCFRPDRYPQDRMKVVLGEHDQCTPDARTVMFSIEKLIQHPKYTSSKRLLADVMLVKLNMRITFNAFIRPICLPQRGKSTVELRYSGRLGDILGWGVGDVPHVSCILRKTSNFIYKHGECKFKSFYLFCAGFPGVNRDACAGDSGGPFQILDDQGKYELIGVTSSGFGCGNEGTPGLYADVIRVLPWIYKATQDSMYCWR